MEYLSAGAIFCGFWFCVLVVLLVSRGGDDILGISPYLAQSPNPPTIGPEAHYHLPYFIRSQHNFTRLNPSPSP